MSAVSIAMSGKKAMTTDPADRTRQVELSVGIVVALALTAALLTVVGHDTTLAAERRLAEREAEATAWTERADAARTGQAARADGPVVAPVAGLVAAPAPPRRVVVVRRSRAS